MSPLDSNTDRVYGRFDGDWDLSLGAGAQWSTQAPRLAVQATAHYFSVAGLSVTYADGLGQQTATRHFLTLGVDVRPVFIPRFGLDLSTGGAWSDLMLDAISLGLGVYWAAPAESDFGTTRGFSASLGTGFPLALEAQGPWLELRGALLFPDARAQKTQAVVQLMLTWHAFWTSPVAVAAP